MAKLRKMLGAADSSYILSLMRKIETQSKETIARWCISYAKENILPIYEKYIKEDFRCREALESAGKYLAGEVKLAEVKKLISNAQNAAREAANPIAEAAARACAQSAAAVHTSTNSLSLAFYGSAAIAYHRVGLQQSAKVYDAIAQEECNKMELALDKVYIENEPNPAKINWYC